MINENLNELYKELAQIRESSFDLNGLTQKQLDAISEKWTNYREIFRPNEKDELFTLVDGAGRFTDLTAPRWLCHLLGLRHMSIHVLLRWMSPSIGMVYVLQVRSWTKSDSPGQLDISVGGHVVGNSSSIEIETAYKEMEEELGITRKNLVGEQLIYRSGYTSYERRDKDNFLNSEWRNIYLAEIKTSEFDRIRFNDKEVVGLYLCPEFEAKYLLNQEIIPIASALKRSLPYCIT